MEQAAEYLRLALAFMGRHGIAPNPLNFSLCYDYVCGHNPALNAALDRAVSGSGFTEITARDLYRQHVWDGEKQRLEDLRAELRKLIVETLTGVTQASDDAARSTHNLAAHSEKLERGPSLNELRSIVATMMSETRTIAHNGTALKHMLDETRQQVESLRDELESTRKQVAVDPLTGLKNRRAFESALHDATNRSAQQGEPLALLVIDIDRFKEVNDTFGHLAGDRVIRSVSTLLSANVKGKDTVARLGGEEFAVLLPDTPLPGAERVGEALRHAVEHSRLRRSNTGETIGHITVSVGVTAYLAGETHDDFIGRADKALYISKRAGRNRVSVLRPGDSDH
jgi:diguanylate cyclase